MKQPSASHSHHAAGFSLIELLTVVLIIGIIAGFVVPAVNGIGHSSSLANAGNAVVDMINLARQEAMTKNTMTALVVLGRQPNIQPTGQAFADEAYRALTVVEYDSVAGWSQITQWEILPTGIVIDCNDAATDPTNSNYNSFLKNSPVTFPFLAHGQQNPPVSFQGQQVASNAYAARIFMPNGALQNPEQPAQLRLVEGYFQGNGVIYTNRNGQRSGNQYDIAILGMTGTTKVTRP